MCTNNECRYLVVLAIECGDTTCAYKPGKFCRMLTPLLNGGGKCHLFGTLVEEGGWIRRHEQCIQSSIPEHDEEENEQQDQ